MNSESNDNVDEVDALFIDDEGEEDELDNEEKIDEENEDDDTKEGEEEL